MTNNGKPYPLNSQNLKQNRVCFLSDIRNLNKQLKRKPYAMPNINEMLLKLEGFQYAMSLDLNIVYYHIQLIKTQVTYVQLLPLVEYIITNV